MPMMQTPTDAGVPPDISAVEEQLRRLGFAANPAGMMTMTPAPALTGAADPQSAVAAILALRDAEFQKVLAARQAAQQAPAPPPPPPPDVPDTNAAQVGGGKKSTSLNPLWALPVVAALAAAARLAGGKGLTRGAAKGAKGTAAAAAAANAARAKVGAPQGRAQIGPHLPQNYPPSPHNFPPSPPVYGPHRPVPGAEEPLELTDVVPPAAAVPPAATGGIALNPDGTLPPPTLTRTDITSEIPLALAERARGNIRVPGEGQLPPPPPLTPRPVLPTYTAPLDEAADLSGSELAKAIRVSGEVARTRARSAAKTERINRRRPGPVDRPPQQFTPDRRVPKEEGERKSFNEVTKAIREAKNPPKAEPKDLKPWLKEPKKAYVGPQLPKKKPGPAPKRKGPPKPAIAEALAERKIVTARKGKTTPQMMSETGRTRPEPKKQPTKKQPKATPVDKTPLMKAMGVKGVVEDTVTGKITLKARDGWYFPDGKTVGVFNSRTEANRAIRKMQAKTKPIPASQRKTSGSGTLSLKTELAKRKKAKGK